LVQSTTAEEGEDRDRMPNTRVMSMIVIFLVSMAIFLFLSRVIDKKAWGYA
jgi:hypothetical protein